MVTTTGGADADRRRLCRDLRSGHRQRGPGPRRARRTRPGWPWCAWPPRGISCSRTCRALARPAWPRRWPDSFDLQWRRIQFTPDLLPSDVTGASVYDRDTGSFTFRPGGVFANVVLGDEINRASPKTQSALLEAMQEGQVTVDNVTHRLPDPFLVIATQNPVEHEGTYPLPESQLDRFLLRVRMGYPDRHAEMDMLDRPESRTSGRRLWAPSPAPTPSRPWSASPAQVHVAVALKGYIVDLATATRNHPALSLGMSPRAALALQRAARALAASTGREYVVPDDIKYLAGPGPRASPRPVARRGGQRASTSPRWWTRSSAACPFRPGRAGRADEPRGPDRSHPNRGWALLAVALSLALGGFLFGVEELYPIAAAGVVLIVASRAWVASRRWDVRVVRHVRPARVPAGVPARVELAVVNHGHAASPILAAQDPFDGGRRWARFLVAPLDPGGVALGGLLLAHLPAGGVRARARCSWSCPIPSG